MAHLKQCFLAYFYPPLKCVVVKKKIKDSNYSIIPDILFIFFFAASGFCNEDKEYYSRRGVGGDREAGEGG